MAATKTHRATLRIMNPFLTELAAICSPAQIRTGEAALAYHTDERNRYFTAPLAVALPRSTTEVAAIVKLCTAHNVALIAQGGNTGVVGGCAVMPQTPTLIVNLSQMCAVRSLDTVNRTLTIESGATLGSVHELLAPHGLLFPLTLASQSAATIGGNLATNAGGTQVLRYGNMRDLCLGLEVVLADGEQWHGLNSLRKNNTGYDLKNLFVGSEGTLGIITAAVLKLYPRHNERITALIAAPDLASVLRSFDQIQRAFDAQLTAFEYISPAALTLVCEQFDYTLPFKLTTHTILLELSINTADAVLHSTVQNEFEAQLAQGIEQGHIIDAVIAQSAKQQQQFWHYREHISAAQKRVGKNIKHDISIPISAIAEFTHAANTALAQRFPGIEPMVFGHIGDGNLHFNVSMGQAFANDTELMHAEPVINQIVYTCVAKYHGSVSAEHGIGLLKRDLLSQVKSDVEMKLMRDIKRTFDPQNILNPHKVIELID